MRLSLKKNDKLTEIETGSEWRVDCRTRGPDVDNGPGAKPSQTWIYVLFNEKGHRRFVPEGQIEKLYTTGTAEAPTTEPS